QVYRLHECPPLRGGLNGDRDEAVVLGRLKDAMGRFVVGARAEGCGNLTVDGVVQDQRLDETDAGFRLGEGDVPARARAQAMEDRGGERRHAQPRADEVRIGAPGATWRPVRPAGDGVQAGERRALAAEAGEGGLRSRLS